FDMRNDIAELKRMVAELGGSAPTMSHSHPAREIFGLLPGSIDHPSQSHTVTDTESEDVTDMTMPPQTKDEMMREAIVSALRRSNGKRKEAAKLLFMSERTLYRRIKEFGIDETEL
ncbi:MAG: sigma-54-dependent Fis family transcriptional regulator, partial [Rikenellaceae bacterium]|nr:sigma-54-dependent Fis family transcriptional regulator [Rikenellaceae bacterium]